MTDFYSEIRGHIYSKEQFQNIIEKYPEISYSMIDDENKQFYDFYIDSTIEDLNFLDDATGEAFATMQEQYGEDDFFGEHVSFYCCPNFMQLTDIENEANDRIWLDRSSVGTPYEKPGLTPKQRLEVIFKQKNVMNTYGVKPEECTDFYHGFWSGVLALSRYLSGNYGADIEALRTAVNGNELLDT